MFHNCVFVNGGVEKESVYLMRPWRNEGKSAFINCTYSDHINSKGFIAWTGLESEKEIASFKADTPRFGEEYLMCDAEREALLKRFQEK